MEAHGNLEVSWLIEDKTPMQKETAAPSSGMLCLRGRCLSEKLSPDLPSLLHLDKVSTLRRQAAMGDAFGITGDHPHV